MKYLVNPNSDSPLYIQLYEQLKRDIITGIYQTGEKLPSKRLLSQDAGVSLITVEHAYSLLCEEGYAEAHERSGFLVTFRTDDGFAPPHKDEESPVAKQVIDTETPPFPFTVMARTARRVISAYAETILAPTPVYGSMELREALATYLKRSQGVDVTPDQIVIGSGAQYLYSLLVLLLGKDRCFAIEHPSYERIQQVYEAHDLDIDLLPLGPDGIDSRSLAQTNASVLHITPYRSFPTGVTATASKRHEYVRWACADKNRYIVEDDYESEFSVASKPAETVFSLSPEDNVIYVNTFSKTISPALRMGYMVLPQRLTTAFDEKLGKLSCTVPTFDQLVVAQFIENGDFARHINRVRRAKRKELAELKNTAL